MPITMGKALNDDHNLCDLAIQCQNWFGKISEISYNGNFVARIEVLFDQTSSSIPILTVRDLNDDHEQFRVWAKNLGVFATDQRSLDFRLREANDVKQGIISLLTSLRSELTAGYSLLEKGPENEQDHVTGFEETIDSNSSSESDDEEYSPTQRAAFEIQARLKRIADVTNKLMRLGEAIRASGVSTRNIKASKYVHFEDGVNMTAQFEEQYLPAILSHKFKLESPLLERFIRAISIRRRRFLYQARHQKRLAYGNEFEEQAKGMKQTPRTSTFKPETSAAEEFIPVHNVTASRISSRVPDPSDRSDMQPPTLATTFDHFPLRHKVQSTIVSASNKSVTSDPEFPPAPQIPDRATHFQCPYCCLLVPRRKLLNRNWREHVITDLQPFICLEPECPIPDQTFENQQEWIEHQKWEHSMEWWCEGNDTQHHSMRFLSSEAYIAHLNHFSKCCASTKSTKTTDKQIETAGRPSLSPFSCCPFCDFLPENMASLTLEAAQDAVSVATTCQKQLQKHIADEMLAIFMIALPDRDDIQDSFTETQSNQSVRTRSTLLSMSTASLNFLDQDEEPIVETTEPSADWNKVWTSPELQQSVRRSYVGIEEDEVLQNLLQSMQNNRPPSLAAKVLSSRQESPPAYDALYGEHNLDPQFVPSLKDLDRQRQLDQTIDEINGWITLCEPVQGLLEDGFQFFDFLVPASPGADPDQAFGNLEGTSNGAMIRFNQQAAAEPLETGSRAATEGSINPDANSDGSVEVEAAEEDTNKELLQAESSNAAMMRFNKLASEAASFASRATTWGTARRFTDFDHIAVGPLPTPWDDDTNPEFESIFGESSKVLGTKFQNTPHRVGRYV